MKLKWVRDMTKKKTHLVNTCGEFGGKTACGIPFGTWETEGFEMLDLDAVDCLKCERSSKYKAMEEQREIFSDMMGIKKEAIEDFKADKDCSTCNNATGDDCKATGRLEFTESGDCSDHKERDPSLTKQVYSPHYKTGGIQTVDKIEEVLAHLEGKINTAQASHIYNFLKYFDRCESKGQYERDIYKSADSIHRAITGKFLNETN
jgi:hypothetical protein